MSLFRSIVEISVNFFQGALFAYMGVSVFESKTRFKTNLYYFLANWLACGVLLTLFIYVDLPSMFLDIVAIITVFVVVTLIFRKGTVFRRAFWPLVYFVLYACISYLIMTIALSLPGVTIDVLLSGTVSRVIFVFAVNAVVIAMTFIFIRVTRHSIDGALNPSVIVVSSALILSNLIALILLLEFASVSSDGLLSPVILIGSAIAIFIANTLVLWMFHHINEQNAKVLQLSAAQLRVEMQSKHLQEVGRIEQELREFRHDIRSHFQYMIAHIEAGEHEKVEGYLRSLATDFDELAMPINTGNAVMDAILNVKLHVASHDSIRFDVKAHLPDRLSIAENDLVIIVSNILDNAIEATRMLPVDEDRMIEVIARILNETLMITVVNKMIETPKKQGVFSLTSKADRKAHGMGLQIINERVTKCGGYVNTNLANNVFEMSAIIPIETT